MTASKTPSSHALCAAQLCLLGGALGDAFGYAVEFDSWSKIQANHGPRGLMDLPLTKQGELIASDDTQMTLFAAEGLIRSCEDGRLSPLELAEEAREAFLDWYLTQRKLPGRPLAPTAGLIAHDPRLWHQRAPGNTCLSALSSGAVGSPEGPANNSKGCGAVMRAAPWAFLEPLLSLEEIWEASSRQGALTHGHPEGHQSAAALSVLLARLLRGEPLLEAAWATEAQARQAGATPTADRLRIAIDARDEALDPAQIISRLGEGWVGEEALCVGLWAALRSADCMQAIRLATNHSGDSDSTASIAGQIAALAFGLSAWEIQSAQRVDLAPLCLALGERLELSVAQALDKSIVKKPGPV